MLNVRISQVLRFFDSLSVPSSNLRDMWTVVGGNDGQGLVVGKCPLFLNPSFDTYASIVTLHVAADESSCSFIPSGSTVSWLALLKVLLVLISKLMVVKQK